MKFIGRAAFGVIDKLIYLLIGKKDFDFNPTPVPDDWPPDGSMHFLRLGGRYRPEHLPPDIVQYEFGANVGEIDPVVFTLGWEIIYRLCGSRQTLIKLICDLEYPKRKRREAVIRPVEIAVQSLRSLLPKASITQRENVVAVLSTGCPRELFSQDQETPDILGCYTSLYLFSEKNTPLDPEEGLSLVEQGQYQAELYLTHGPNSLNVVFNPEALDITEVEKVIEEVCRAHNILLMNPHGEWELP